MTDVADLPHERWTVEVDYPDRESAFAAARRWADERGDTAVAWRWPTFYGPTDAEGDGNEREGWLVKPGTPSVADVIAGRAGWPARFGDLGRLIAMATPEELAALRVRALDVLGAEKAELEWRCAESCVDLYRYGTDADEERRDIADAEAALTEPGDPIPAVQVWANLGLEDVEPTH
jgi:hypothetical protein